MTFTVTGLYRYPVKSLAALSCESLLIDDWGPANDRRWMVVDDSGRFVTQRQLPRMCRILAEESHGQLALRDLDSGDGIELAEPAANQPLSDVQVWRDAVGGQDAGDAVAHWLSHRLGRTLRLCFMPGSVHRQVDRVYAAPGTRVSYADGFPFLLCHSASLDFLAQKLGRALDMRRFRPNIVVSGGEPFAEADWRRVLINNIEFELVKPCSRCAIPTVDLNSGKKEADVFPLLRKYCQSGREVIFGQNALHRGRGAIELGDRVEVLL